MKLEARKLTSVLLLLGIPAAVLASACGDSSSSGTGGGGGSDPATTVTGTSATGSGGGPVDSCTLKPEACFDPAACLPSLPTGVSFRADLLPLLQRSCSLSSACHSDPASPTTNEGYKPYLGNKKGEGESDIPTIREAIIDVDSWGDPSHEVVVPGDWQASYFMNKLNGALDQCPDLDCLDCGRLMPQGSPKPLPLEERNKFRGLGIAQDGAPDN